MRQIMLRGTCKSCSSRACRPLQSCSPYLCLLYLTSAFAALQLLATACAKTEDVAPASGPSHDDDLALGNLSGAVASTASPSNYLLVKDQYTLSYNRDQGKPNWVNWHLSSAWQSNAPRQDDFRADASLPSGWYQVKPSDYTGYGFD